jgi:anti-anti-sigma regulatory factor
MPLNIKKPFIVPNKCKDPYAFEEVLQSQEELYTTYNGILDLSRVTFIEPYSMVSLLLLGRNYLRNRGEKLSLVNIPMDIHQYLSRMDFLSAGVFNVIDRLDEKLLYKKSSFSRRVVEITEVPNKERESIRAISGIISLFRKRAQHILKFWISSNIIDYFVTVISEVCQNIFEHSLDSGYCAMQTYAMGNEHIVRLIIADSGIGIRESFAQKPGISFDSNAKLTEMALTTPLSSKRRYGYGLCQVNAIIEKLRGSIYIRSTDSSVAVMYNRKHAGGSYSFLKNDLPAFPGTQISISLFG